MTKTSKEKINSQRELNYTVILKIGIKAVRKRNYCFKGGKGELHGHYNTGKNSCSSGWLYISHPSENRERKKERTKERKKEIFLKQRQRKRKETKKIFRQSPIFLLMMK